MRLRAVRGDATFGIRSIGSGRARFQMKGTADGQTDCTVPAAGSIRAADTSGFTEWDIRKKRDSGGNLRSFAGLVGKRKTCRDKANLAVFNNATAPADA